MLETSKGALYARHDDPTIVEKLLLTCLLVETRMYIRPLKKGNIYRHKKNTQASERLDVPDRENNLVHLHSALMSDSYP